MEIERCENCAGRYDCGPYVRYIMGWKEPTSGNCAIERYRKGLGMSARPCAPMSEAATVTCYENRLRMGWDETGGKWRVLETASGAVLFESADREAALAFWKRHNLQTVTAGLPV